MASIRFDGDGRFTCRQCGRCCRSGWSIALTTAEAERLRDPKAARFYRNAAETPEGEGGEPVETVPGRGGAARIAKRPDGVCGFLSPQGRCRVQEEWGYERKPLTCRAFPFHFHKADDPPVVAASFCCPTVVANLGTPLSEQANQLARLAREWFEAHPEKVTQLEWVRGRALPRGTLGILRSILETMLARSGPDSAIDLKANVGRMARTIDDLTRPRVLRLEPEAFAEYLQVTGTYAARTEKSPEPCSSSGLGRLFSRGVLFAVAATDLQLAHGTERGLRLRLRWQIARLLLHLHGLGPAVGRFDRKAGQRARVDWSEAEIRDVARNYLRSGLATLGKGRRSVVDEIAVHVALLNAAAGLATMRAAHEGRTLANVGDISQGMLEASQLEHVEGAFARILGRLAAGPSALHTFAAEG